MPIQVNLLGGPKKRRRAGGGAKLSMPDLGAWFSQVKDPLLLGAVGSWVVVGGAIAFLFVGQTARLALLESDAERSRAEARRFSALIAQKRKAEALRDSIVSELQAIRRIDGDRYVWSHILEEITKALPDYTWLTGVQPLASGVTAVGVPGADTLPPPPVRFRIDGRTTDIGAYTTFLRQLQASPWVAGVEAGATSTVQELGKDLTAFAVTVTYQRADSAYFRTVPVTESVR